jgi:hypothetical protein
LPPGEAAKERPTLFKTMIGTLNHNYLIDLVWQAHIEGRDHGFQVPARNPATDLPVYIRNLGLAPTRL